MKFKLQRFISLALLFVAGFSTPFAQVIITDINKSSIKPITKANENARLEVDTPLELPFWDDFSWTGTIPSDSLWENSDNVEISASIGINAPTYKVATFDGVKINGAPYSFNFADFESGDTDTLTSRPINLSGLTTSEKNSVYLSFFYQKQGNGELPENDDGLRVEFLSMTEIDTTWETGIHAIAPLVINGANVTDTAFHQTILQVAGEQYFHENFQFRIISSGRKTGPFDNWNVDYVYLNKNRNINDLSYDDRSFNSPITSPFKYFTSIPIDHFKLNQQLFENGITSSFNNLGITDVFNFDLDASIIYYNSSDTVASAIQKLESVNFSISNTEKASVVSNTLIDYSALTDDTKVAQIKLNLYGDLAEEKISNKIYNSLINDTIKATYYLKDYYAYDDGTAEKGAGVNSIGDEIAYQFPFLGPETSYFNGMDIYFPQTFESNQHGEQIKIKVWSNNSGQPGELIFSKFFTIPKIDSINQFYRIALNSPFQVLDTFYIGWEQLSSTKLFVGLDKNTNTQDKIWINTTGEWEPNNNQIEGSLMIRPFFITPETSPLATTQETDTKKITIYPNPSSRYFKFAQMENMSWTVLTASGQQVQPISFSDNQITVLDFENLPKGLYILKFIYKDSIQTERILLIE